MRVSGAGEYEEGAKDTGKVAVIAWAHLLGMCVYTLRMNCTRVCVCVCVCVVMEGCVEKVEGDKTYCLPRGSRKAGSHLIAIYKENLEVKTKRQDDFF